MDNKKLKAALDELTDFLCRLTTMLEVVSWKMPPGRYQRLFEAYMAALNGAAGAVMSAAGLPYPEGADSYRYQWGRQHLPTLARVAEALCDSPTHPEPEPAGWGAIEQAGIDWDSIPERG